MTTTATFQLLVIFYYYSLRTTLYKKSHMVLGIMQQIKMQNIFSEEILVDIAVSEIDPSFAG